MKKLYSGEVLIAATVYVRADSAEEARAEIERLQDQQTGIEFSGRRQEVAEELFVTGESFTNELPRISLSPAMTIQKSVTRPQVWMAEELEGEGA